jgi:hypothetical protein
VKPATFPYFAIISGQVEELFQFSKLTEWLGHDS